MTKAMVRLYRFYIAPFLLLLLATFKLSRELWFCLRMVSWWAISAPTDMSFEDAYVVAIKQMISEIDIKLEEFK